ncbi:hypothetical protein ACFSOZ_30685 [Mesorhizobium newzealandense]|uniref:Uncharacterized protein n=1 Tax=Mesorhizobium newzealandense TaxID=1300302 RepID=A0ABW4UK18_9HYPH
MTLDQLVDTGDFPIGATRRSIEDRIEKLIELLDIVDDDVDLEDTADDEPSLGGYGGDDRELDNADDEDDGTEEPTLGAPERHPRSYDIDPLSGLALPRSGFLRPEPGKSQEHWADGARGDHEREADADFEAEHDPETVMWGDDIKSQEVLVTL